MNAKLQIRFIQFVVGPSGPICLSEFFTNEQWMR